MTDVCTQINTIFEPISTPRKSYIEPVLPTPPTELEQTMSAIEAQILAKPYVSQNDLVLISLFRFYGKEDNLENMLNILAEDHRLISLRIIDWFVTNYAKKNFTTYPLLKPRQTTPIQFKVYNEYRLNLSSYRKKRFDPFCRWERINFPYINGRVINTTIGQMKFFKWMIESKVIEYIVENYSKIEKDMNDRNSTKKNKDASAGSGPKTRKKRKELSVSASRSIKREVIQGILKFN
jgi:hypothetical protein